MDWHLALSTGTVILLAYLLADIRKLRREIQAVREQVHQIAMNTPRL